MSLLGIDTSRKSPVLLDQKNGKTINLGDTQLKVAEILLIDAPFTFLTNSDIVGRMKSGGVSKSSIQNLHSTIRTLRKKLTILENDDVGIEGIKGHIGSGGYFGRNGDYSPENIIDNFIIDEGIYFFPGARVIYSEDAGATKLGPLEYTILHTLISQPGCIFSREDLAETFTKITGQQIDPDNIPSYMNRVRTILTFHGLNLGKRIPYESSLSGYTWDNDVSIENEYLGSVLSISLQKIRVLFPGYKNGKYEGVALEKDEFIFCVLLGIYDGSLNFRTLESYMPLRGNAQAGYIYNLMNSINQKFSSAGKTYRVSARKTTFAFSHFGKQDSSKRITLPKGGFEY